MGSCQSYCAQPRHATKRKDWCCLSVHELCKAPSLTQQKISIRLKTACMFCLLKHDLSHLFRPIICISPCNLSHGGSSLILFKLYSIICAMRRTLDCELSRADHCCRRRAEHLGQLLAVTLHCTDCKFFEIYFFSLQVDFNSMKMTRPQRGAIRRLFEPALWLNYTSSDHYHSFYCKMHRIQV